MSDAFLGQSRSLNDPATTIFEITPDDATDLPHVTTGINVASPGTIRVTMADGSIGDLNINPGVFFPLRVIRIWLTGTTATGIRGLT